MIEGEEPINTERHETERVVQAVIGLTRRKIDKRKDTAKRNTS
jgi:hypothetical protein